MTLYVSEYTNSVAGRYRQPTTPQAPVKSYALSTAGTSTGLFPQAGTQFIRVSADAGMLLSLNSGTTLATLTSTNAVRIPGNALPEIFAVSTAFLIQTAST